MSRFLEGFLKRINYKGKETITFADLPKLMAQFAYHIPFENTDIMNELDHDIDKAFLFHKMIEHHRGGLCYELNPLLYYVLEELGFNVQMIQATINKKKTLQHTHISTVLFYEGNRYLVDVGFGANQALQPVPFTGEFVSAVGGTYRVRELPEEGQYVYERFNNHALEISYLFTMKEISETEVNRAKNLVTIHTESPFNKGLLLTITTPKGHQTLTDTSLTVVENGQKQKENVNETKKQQITQQLFGINLLEIE